MGVLVRPLPYARARFRRACRRVFRASFVKVNVDDEGAAAAKYGVMSIPDVFVFEGGAVKAHNLGYLPESAMRAFLEKNI